jgi:hypothetical protein
MTLAPTQSGRSTLFAAATSESPGRTGEITAAWTTLPGGVVDGGEIVVMAIKPSMWRPLLASAPALAICMLAAGVVAGLAEPLGGLSPAVLAQIILLIALARLAIAIALWIPTWYVLTNRRVIHIEGVREPRIGSIPLVEVRNTYLHVSPGERVTRLGTITMVTDQSERPAMIWQSVSRPSEVHAKLRRAIEDAIDRHSLKF